MISFQIWIAIKKTYKSWAQGPGIITHHCYSPDLLEFEQGFISCCELLEHNTNNFRDLGNAYG